MHALFLCEHCRFPFAGRVDLWRIGVLLRETVQEGIGEKLKDAIVLYREPNKPDLQLLIETTQTEFKCCGIISYEDWGIQRLFQLFFAQC